MSDNIWHISAGSEPNIGQRNKLNGSDLYDIRCMHDIPSKIEAKWGKNYPQNGIQKLKVNRT
ncbi:MAG TPA: hypothetical protein VEL47_07460 [Myxococcota bacterium]|nr:hypothetical protein [Myxococcota bacterium]